ncbi:MAG: acetolactate synthase small subunit [Actinomycetia bacterium]|nr:acetolactate synthase small subunit [Actinomycetes bacterium]
MNHTLSVLVENKPGVLTRVASLFARRGFNIDSLAVGVTEDPTLSRMTIVVAAEDALLEQVTKQLHKLINVIKIQDLNPKEMIDRELVLFKVNAPPERRHEIIEIANVFRAKIIDVGRQSVTIEATGAGDKLMAMEDLLRTYGIKELTRTGKIALARGSKDAS